MRLEGDRFDVRLHGNVVLPSDVKDPSLTSCVERIQLPPLRLLGSRFPSRRGVPLAHMWNIHEFLLIYWDSFGPGHGPSKRFITQAASPIRRMYSDVKLLLLDWMLPRYMNSCTGSIVKKLCSVYGVFSKAQLTRENCQKHRKGYVIKIETCEVKSILIEVRFGLSRTTSSRQLREMRYSKHRNNCCSYTSVKLTSDLFTINVGPIAGKTARCAVNLEV